MKTILTLGVVAFVSFSNAVEPTIPVYPKDYPGKHYSFYVAKYGKPGSTEFGTGARPRDVIHFSTNPVDGPDTIHPVLPPNLAESDEVMYCYWPSAIRDEQCIWFRRIEGEWVSFWNSAQSNRIFCGIYLRVGF